LYAAQRGAVNSKKRRVRGIRVNPEIIARRRPLKPIKNVLPMLPQRRQRLGLLAVVMALAW